MNTIDDWKTVGQIDNPERKSLWEHVFGGDQVPLKSIIPQYANVAGKSHVLIYELDLNVLTPAQSERLVAAIIDKFGAGREEVEKELKTNGMPVLASDVTVTSRDIEEVWDVCSNR